MRRIRYTHKRNRGCYGKAYLAEWRIEIDPDLDDKTEMDIALHEALHIRFPYMTESDVNDAAKLQADLLWRLGYRRNEDED